MSRSVIRSVSAVIALSLIPLTALAKDSSLVPLIPKNADSQQVVNVTQLIWSELEFMPDYDSADLLDRSPAELNLSCLNSASCLRGIAAEAGGDEMVVGSLSTTSKTFELDLVLFDVGGGRIVRRQAFTLGANPEAVADGMNAVVRELVTGVAPAQAAEQEPELADFSMDDDMDFFDDDGGDDFGDFDISDEDPGEAAREADRRDAEEKARREAEEKARREAEERARREAEERERRAAEERARREREERERAEQERREREERERAERERREREEREARARAAAEEEPEELDLSMISFGSAADQVTEEEIASSISFGSAVDEVTEEGSSSSRSSSNYYEEEDDFLDEDDDFSLADLDNEDDRSARREKPEREKPEREKPERSSRRSSSSSSRATVSRDDDDRRMFTTSLRVGYSLYGSLNFLTYGVELGIPVHDVIYVMAGVEGYSVERSVPPKFQTDGRTTEWNHIAPINVGAMYKNRSKAFQPYVGADLILANYYVDAATGQGAWAVGGRLRGGLDYMLATNIGLNLNVSLGYWAGDKWTLIDQNTQNGGILPQVSAGTVIAF